MCLFCFPPTVSQRGRTREGGIRGQGYLPFRWRGGQPELLRRENENIFSARWTAGCWKTAWQFLKEEKAEKVSVESERIKRKKKTVNDMSFCPSVSPSILCLSLKEWEIERVQEKESACVRLRGALDTEDWMLERSSTTKIHFKTRLKETGRRARHERRDVTVATYQ